MKKHVVSLILTNDEIFSAVVGGISVNMMNNRFTRKKFSKNGFCDMNMLKNVSATVSPWMIGNHDTDYAIRLGIGSPTLPIWVLLSVYIHISPPSTRALTTERISFMME